LGDGARDPRAPEMGLIAPSGRIIVAARESANGTKQT
jgi:hypothetical protein